MLTAQRRIYRQFWQGMVSWRWRYPKSMEYTPFGSHFNVRFLIVLLPILDHNNFSSLLFAIHFIFSSGKYYIFADRHKNVLCLCYHYIFDEINVWLLLSPNCPNNSSFEMEKKILVIETWMICPSGKYFLLTPAPKRPNTSRRWPLNAKKWIPSR